MNPFRRFLGRPTRICSRDSDRRDQERDQQSFAAQASNSQTRKSARLDLPMRGPVFFAVEEKQAATRRSTMAELWESIPRTYPAAADLVSDAMQEFRPALPETPS